MKQKNVDWAAIYRGSISAETLARDLTITWAKKDINWMPADFIHAQLSNISAALGYRVEKIVSDKEAHETMIAKRVAEDDR